MICDRCVYSDFQNTEVPSCMMPNCRMPLDKLARRYSKLYGIERMQKENAEFRMIAKEIARRGK